MGKMTINHTQEYGETHFLRQPLLAIVTGTHKSVLLTLFHWDQKTLPQLSQAFVDLQVLFWKCWISCGRDPFQPGIGHVLSFFCNIKQPSAPFSKPGATLVFTDGVLNRLLMATYGRLETKKGSRYCISKCHVGKICFLDFNIGWYWIILVICFGCAFAGDVLVKNSLSPPRPDLAWGTLPRGEDVCMYEHILAFSEWVFHFGRVMEIEGFSCFFSVFITESKLRHGFVRKYNDNIYIHTVFIYIWRVASIARLAGPEEVPALKRPATPSPPCRRPTLVFGVLSEYRFTLICMDIWI